MMRIAVITIVVAVVIAVLTTQRRTFDSGQTLSGEARRQIITNAPYAERRPARLGDVLTDAQEPEFVERVLPGVLSFFSRLDDAGVNPLKDKRMSFQNIKISYPPNGLICRFIINDAWTGTYLHSPKSSGMMHFGRRGHDNPFRAISHGNTNALARLSENAIKMPREEAERIISHLGDVFGVDRSQFEKPKIYAERLFDYDLGICSVRYQTKGTDPLKGLNYPLRFSVKASSQTTAVLVEYGDTR